MMAVDDWINHRNAIDCYGHRFVPGWTGAEHMAFGPVAYNRETAAILDTTDDIKRAAYERAVQEGIDQTRAAPVLRPGAPCASCGAPSVRVVMGKAYCALHGTRQPIPANVLKRIAAHAARADDEEGARRASVAGGEQVLLEKLDRDYDPERAAHSRMLHSYEELRDHVLSSKVEVRGRWPGGNERWPVLLDELRDRYPGPREARIELPSLPLPMTLEFNRGHILALPARRLHPAAVTDRALANLAAHIAQELGPSASRGEIEVMIGTQERLRALCSAPPGGQVDQTVGVSTARKARDRLFDGLSTNEHGPGPTVDN
jgi:uncharacterized Zn finger protein (UPF0148 family)